ncbi:LPXTG cell wall anchor domain-containing protein [Streptomyces sp. A5-4]|uniref:LPXTG cell wall anchor domain-containing protein n=1 Tax=Streptomyces sp. A5-4 TaxID=3384771 RepID=UPI003DA7ED95
MRLRSALVLGVTAAMAAPVAVAVAADARTAAGSTAYVTQRQAQAQSRAETQSQAQGRLPSRTRTQAEGRTQPHPQPQPQRPQWRVPPAPSCGDPSSAGFPIDTRIHGGPATYRPGHGFEAWYVDLANTTTRPCRNIHPVVVLTDRARTLDPAQIRLEFHDPAADRWHPVRFEKTDEDELVGAFDDGFPGFAVPAGKTVPVKVRLAFTADALTGQVVANAATVQRQGDDGDWVGESNDYRFTMAAAIGDESSSAGDSDTDSGSGRDSHSNTDSGSGRNSHTDTDTDTDTDSGRDSHSNSDSGSGRNSHSDNNRGDGTGFAQPPSSLAKTGSEHLLGLGVTAGVLLLLGGGALVVGRRRFRTGRY